MSFSKYLMQSELKERYDKVKSYFHLRESAYDVSSACQLRCEGCYYFQGDKYKTRDLRDKKAWKAFLENERVRGINYVNLAGAEPALVPDILKQCHEIIPLGTVFTNGLRKIPTDIGYRIHISVWGNEQGDPKYRRFYGKENGPYCLPIQLNNYRDDERVIFVYTFNGLNIDEVDDVMLKVAESRHKITFNVFSAPLGYGVKSDRQDQWKRTRAKMLQMIDLYPDSVLYSYYNAKVHTAEMSLHGQFTCPYPRANIGKPVRSGIGSTFRSYRTDLSHNQMTDCCVPDTECQDCRHYAAGSAIVTSRLKQHCESEEEFRGWLDYVDTYLAIWIPGYELGKRLYPMELAMT